MPISLLVVARRSQKMPLFPVNPAEEGVFGSDIENSLFEAELKFCIFTPKKYFAHSGISSTRNSRNSGTLSVII